jgi:alpha-tubulin suppressor-like RCC1 family protein
LILDSEGSVYTYGAGRYGQLGQGPNNDVARFPLPLTEINDSMDKVKLIACGSNFNICYTELGILYYWGMLVPDDFENIQWFPNFMPISIQKSDYVDDESFLYEFHLTDVQATYREILACDSKGRLYHADLLQS